MKFVLALVIVFIAFSTSAVSAQEPPRVEQPHQDIFDAPGFSDLSEFNDLTQQVKVERKATYRLLTLSSCTSGTIPNDLLLVGIEAKKVDLDLSRNDFEYDFTIRINCGTNHISVCGAINVFCLGRGFPFNQDVDISDILSSYFPITRISILSHEVIGHAIATWNEQYCKGQIQGNYTSDHICFQLTRFTPAPNWIDFMNTGANSRHGIELIELERWERTMYLLDTAPTILPPWGPCADWDGCYHQDVAFWIASDGWIYNTSTGVWTPHRSETSWGGYWNNEIGRWIASDGSLHSGTGAWELHPIGAN